ncbi:preprotein translocase subunit TatC [Geobacter sulfurreducens]|nr:preprotein translocase subunit TatC [Geobacter sulfurreducens]
MSEQYASFLKHLEELRRRLIVIIVAVVFGMGVAWSYSDSALRLLERPLNSVTYLTVLKRLAFHQLEFKAPKLYERLGFTEEVVAPEKLYRLNYSAPLEPFFVQCKIAMLLGLVFALPVVFWQIWQFVAPGLTVGERRLVGPFVVFSTLAFCLGAAFFLAVIWPVVINFSLSYEVTGLQSWFNISAYVNFCLRLVLMFGLIFELPVLTLVLARFGLVNYSMLAPKRKYALLASSIVAAFHADLVTMFVIMVPLYLMYEISIWVALLFGKSQAVDDAAVAKLEPV